MKLTDHIVQLVDGKRTAAQIAIAAGTTERFVRTHLTRCGLIDRIPPVPGRYNGTSAGRIWADPTNVEYVMKGILAGKSAGILAAELSAKLDRCVSRNAVIGKIFRLGLMRSSIVREFNNTKRAKFGLALRNPGGTPGRRFTKKPKAQNPWTGANLPKLVVDNTPTSELPPAIASVSFAGLLDGLCKWPVGDPQNSDFGYCGLEAVPLSPYCPTCLKRAYIRVPERVKQFLKPEAVPEPKPELEAV